MLTQSIAEDQVELVREYDLQTLQKLNPGSFERLTRDYLSENKSISQAAKPKKVNESVRIPVKRNLSKQQLKAKKLSAERQESHDVIKQDTDTFKELWKDNQENEKEKVQRLIDKFSFKKRSGFDRPMMKAMEL